MGNFWIVSLLHFSERYLSPSAHSVACALCLFLKAQTKSTILEKQRHRPLQVRMFIILYIFFWGGGARQPPVGQGLLINKVSRSHTTTHHTRWETSGRVISSSQRPLPDNIQHSRQTSMPPVRFEPTISAGERLQTYAWDRAATGTGLLLHITYRKSAYSMFRQKLAITR